MEVERVHARNGGFPEPVSGQPVRLVRCRHDACGTATRVRVPQALPARAVRRVVCEGCSQSFECDGADDAGVVAQAEGDRSPRQSAVWKYLSLPLAAAAVIGILVLVQGGGGGESDQQAAAPAATPGPDQTAGSRSGGVSKPEGSAELIKGSSYTLALPDGWAQAQPENGATFAAAAQGGGAEATLWVTRDPSLSFPEFESRSLTQLRQTAGSAEVTDRTAAPTAAGTIVTLAANPPEGGPDYEVTLRVAGPYRYYLATTVEPDASQTATEGAELIRSSFVPVATGKSG
jgi:hypothetical protein